VLYRALTAARSAYQAGERTAKGLRQVMAETIRAEPLARLQYVSVADTLTLAELQTVEKDALLSMAVFVGKTRLIDNFLLREGTWSTGEIVD
jgi:pantoate--beta-alanine ligase